MSDLVARLRSPAAAFYEYAADGGALLREAADRIEALEAKVERLTQILHDSYMLLPVVPESELAWGDSDLTPHVRAVADEWAVRERQLAAEQAEVQRLEEVISLHSDAICELLEANKALRCRIPDPNDLRDAYTCLVWMLAQEDPDVVGLDGASADRLRATLEVKHG
jgi:hypothetical protein